MIRVQFEVHEAHGPALRSVVEELSVTVANRAEQPQAYAVEQAVTEALVAVGALRKAVCAAIPAGHLALRPSFVSPHPVLATT